MRINNRPVSFDTVKVDSDSGGNKGHQGGDGADVKGGSDKSVKVDYRLIGSDSFNFPINSALARAGVQERQGPGLEGLLREVDVNLDEVSGDGLGLSGPEAQVVSLIEEGVVSNAGAIINLLS